MTNIFVYGTLMFPEVVFALTKKKFVMKDSVLKGYSRFRVNDPKREKKGPAIIEQKDGEVHGKILFDVDEKSIKILDRFEGASYRKRVVSVIVDGKSMEAIIYVGSNFNKKFLYGDWSEEEFEQKYLHFYLKTIIPKFLDKIRAFE